LNRIVLAFRCFFNLLFGGALSPETLAALHLAPQGTQRQASPAKPSAAAAPPPPAVKTSDGALQLLAILQRDSRLIDFLMEDISAYEDGQIGAAVRELHDQCRDAINRYVSLEPVIDGVEGAFTKTPSSDPAVVKFVGNVPAKPPSGGLLRHKGWRAAKVDLPAIVTRTDSAIIAPAEIEIE
jgi:Domain of unknown function (DUF2760)